MIRCKLCILAGFWQRLKAQAKFPMIRYNSKKLIMTYQQFFKNEELRIENLHSYEILDTAREDEFDDLIKLVCHICQCEVAMISFIDKNRQWFKAKKKHTRTFSLNKIKNKEKNRCVHIACMH